MASVVLDASAIIALLRNEAGAERIAERIGDALISAVNLQEVVKALILRGMPLHEAKQTLDELFLEVVPHDAKAAYSAAALVEVTQVHGRGLGDRSCMALAIHSGLPVMTTDKAWMKLDIKGLIVEVVR